MRKHLIAILFPIIFINVSGQDLNSAWDEINKAFQANNFSEVIEKCPAFISQLQKLGLRKESISPQIFLGIAFGKVDRFVQSDSVFSEVLSLAEELGELEQAEQIKNTQAQLYWQSAEKLSKTDLFRARASYYRVSEITASTKNYNLRVASLYRIAELYAIDGEPENAIPPLEQAMKYLSYLDESQSSLKSAVQSKLIEMYLQTGQAERAQSFTGVETDQNKLAINFKRAEELENEARYFEADKVLQSVQPLVFSTGDIALIESFVKKRISFFRFSDNLNAGIDTLHNLIDLLEMKYPGENQLIFNFKKLFALACLDEGRIVEANDQVEKLSGQVEEGDLPGSFLPNVLQLKADIAYLQGLFANSIEFYEKAVKNSKNFSPDDLFSLWNNLALAYIKTGRYDKALEYLAKLEFSAQSNNRPQFEVQAYINSGVVFIRKGKYDKAIEKFKSAKKTAEKYSLTKMEILSGLRLAEGYRLAGLPATDFVMEVKRKFDSIQNPHLKLQILSSFARYEKSAGNLDNAALYIQQAFDIAVNSGLENAAIPLSVELGDINLFNGNGKQAREYYNYASKFYFESEILDEKIPLLLRISQAYTVESKFDSSDGFLLRSFDELYNGELTDFRKPEIEKIIEPFLFSLTLTAHSYNKFIRGVNKDDIRLIFSAYEESQKAVEILSNNFYSQISNSKNRSDDWLKNINSFQLLIRIASTLYEKTDNFNYLETAFNTNEKLRAQTFIIDVGQKLVSRLNDPAVKKLSNFDEMFSSDLYDDLNLEIEPENTGFEVATRGLKITKAKNEDKFEEQDKYNEIVDKLRESDSKAADMVSISTLSLSAVQGFLERSDVILNYFIGEHETLLFLIEPDHFDLYKIPLTKNEVSVSVEEFRKKIQEPNSQEYKKLAVALYDKLLGSVTDKITAKRLMIIPSGKLHNLPFAALMHNGKFLTETNSISILPNATFLQFAKNRKFKPAEAKLLAIGNPTNSFTTALPGAEKEVREINKIFLNSRAFLRENAREDIVKHIAGDYDIVHFACHGLFNSDYPLMSALALAPDAENDGRLEVHEIYDVNLSNTDLVVMSACQTGLSQIKKNDDMIGLVRGFLYAGVPSVIASLWKVDDLATFELMTKFYGYLYQGQNKSDALKLAQESLISSATHSHPFYWSAFVLNGYWK